MKKIISIILSICMISTLCTSALAAESGRGQQINTYSGQFTDIPDSSWYAQYVRIAYEYGIMSGMSDTIFSPDSYLSVAEALAIACRLHSLYAGINNAFPSGPSENPWYQSYVDYALNYQIIDADNSYVFTDPVTRADFALLISNSLPDETLPLINDISFPDIPDVYSNSPLTDVASILPSIDLLEDSSLWIYGISAIERQLGITKGAPSVDACDAVYRLYDAGVLTGNDEYGTFTPDANITRSAVAAIVSRVMEPSLRQHITLTPKPKKIVPMDQLANLSSLQKRASRDELAQAYEVAKKIAEPFANSDLVTQVCGVTIAVQRMYAEKVDYSMSADHYSDPYGFFVLNVASCAGCTRALGLCLNMLGIPYEHVNENGYTHQWARVNVNGTYWVCDAQSLYFGPEKVPYEYPG